MFYLPRRYVDKYMPNEEAIKEVVRILGFVEISTDTENYHIRLPTPNSLIELWWDEFYEEGDEEKDISSGAPVRHFPVAYNYTTNPFIEAYDNLDIELSPQRRHLLVEAFNTVKHALWKRGLFISVDDAFFLGKASSYLKYYFNRTGKKFSSGIAEGNKGKYEILVKIIRDDIAEDERIAYEAERERRLTETQDLQYAQELQGAEQLDEIYKIKGDSKIFHPKEYEYMATEFAKKSYVGKGSYGCVYSPAIPCKGSPHKEGYISKVLSREDAKAEMDAHEIISRLDPKNRYMITNPTVCEPTKLQAKTLRESCGVRLSHNIRLLYFQNGGETLEKIVDRYPGQKVKILRGLRNVLSGINLLNSHNVFHCDVKPENIVGKLVKGEYVFKLIDFGLSRVVTPEEYGSLEIFASPYVYWPPECAYLTDLEERGEALQEAEYREYARRYVSQWRDHIGSGAPYLKNYDGQTVHEIMLTIDIFSFLATLRKINTVFEDENIDEFANTLIGSRENDVDRAIESYDRFLTLYD
jgi:Protein kinase domain